MTNKNLNLTNENKAAVRPDFAAEAVRLLRSDLAPGVLRERLLAYHEGDLAAALGLMSAEERLRLCRALGPDALAGVLEHTEERNACATGPTCFQTWTALKPQTIWAPWTGASARACWSSWTQVRAPT